MSTLLGNTIWAPKAIPADEWKYRHLKRVVFPLIDTLFIMAGLLAFEFGILSVKEFFPIETVKSFGLLLILAGWFCLLGDGFPKLWPLEMLGRSVLLGLLVIYFVSLFVVMLYGEANRGIAFSLTGVAIVLICWRISLIGNEWQARRLKKIWG